MNAAEKKINELFDRLVPASGKADTVAGEIVRAIARIGYRYLNDGDCLGIGYGRETVNPAARYLSEKCDDAVTEAIADAWGIHDEATYEKKLEEIETAVLEFLEAHPELETEQNTEDMHDYQDKYEDVDNDEDEDDYEEQEDEDYDDED